MANEKPNIKQSFFGTTKITCPICGQVAPRLNKTSSSKKAPDQFRCLMCGAAFSSQAVKTPLNIPKTKKGQSKYAAFIGKDRLEPRRKKGSR